MLISVDLPQPFGPNTETMRPFGMSRSKFSYSGQPAKYLVSPRMVMWVPAGPGAKRGEGGSSSAIRVAGRMAISRFQWMMRRSISRNSTLSA